MTYAYDLTGEISPYVAFQDYNNWSGPTQICGFTRISDELTCIFLDATPFYPLNEKWPDQPSDKGQIIIEGEPVEVVRCVRGWQIDNECRFRLDTSIERILDKRLCGVGHIIVTNSLPDKLPPQGGIVIPQVDIEYRNRISLYHTASHLFALALNEALASCWNKPTKNDGLGNPDFDGLAIESSTITENGSIETYRIGRSLRKKGFMLEGLSSLGNLRNEVENIMDRFVRHGNEVKVTPVTGILVQNRTWSCSIEGRLVEIPCGGTHITNTNIIKNIGCVINRTESTITFSLSVNKNRVDL